MPFRNVIVYATKNSANYDISRPRRLDHEVLKNKRKWPLLQWFVCACFAWLHQIYAICQSNGPNMVITSCTHHTFRFKKTIWRNIDEIILRRAVCTPWLCCRLDLQGLLHLFIGITTRRRSFFFCFSGAGSTFLTRKFSKTPEQTNHSPR